MALRTNGQYEGCDVVETLTRVGRDLSSRITKSRMDAVSRCADAVENMAKESADYVTNNYSGDDPNTVRWLLEDRLMELACSIRGVKYIPKKRTQDP